MTPTRRPAASDAIYIFMATSRKLQKKGAGAKAGALSTFMCAKHALGIDKTKAIGAAELLGNARRQLISIAARPIALQFKEILQGCHRAGTVLHHAINRSLMCFERDIAAALGNDVDLITLITGGQCCPANANAGLHS